MNPSSRKSATFSIGSDSSSVYSEDEFKSEANTTGTLLHHRSQLQPNLGGIHRENAQGFAGVTDLPLTRDMATPDLDKDHGSTQAASSSHTTTYRFETHEEAEERRRQSAAAVRKDTHNASRDTISEELTTYMQRVLAEHDTASSNNFPTLYRCANGNHAVAGDAGVVFPAPPIPNWSHLRRGSTGSLPAPHARDTLLSFASLTSTDAGERAQEYILETASLRDRLRENMNRASIEESVEPSTPLPRATSLSLSPSSLHIDQSGFPASSGEVNRDDTLQALDGATKKCDNIQSYGSGQWLGAGRQASAAARRQGRPNWQKGTLFSSTSRQYGLGDYNNGYVSGEYITVTAEAEGLEKKKRKRCGLKRLFCIAG